MIALTLVAVALGVVAYTRAESQRRLTAAERQGLPRQAYSLQDLCADFGRDREALKASRERELRALIRQLRRDKDVDVLVSFTVADPGEGERKVQQRWIGLVELVEGNIETMERIGCRADVVRTLRALT
jgi:hypothetical protein